MKIVFTGGPGAGKTTLAHALQAHGFAVARDAAREIIRDRRARGLSPRPDPAAFAEAILQESIAQHEQAHGRVIFERGVVDAIGMCEGAGLIDGAQAQRLAAACRYDTPVFIFPPWQAIYRQDAERDHTFEHAAAVYELVLAGYRRFEYPVVIVPPGTLDARVAFVLDTLGAARR